MKITVIGMSHVEALRYALPPDQGRIEIINVTQRRAGMPKISSTDWLGAPDAFRNRFKATLNRESHFISMLGGNYHSAVGLIEHPRRFDFFEPHQDETELDPDRQLIPYDAMRAMFERRLAPYLRWLGDLAPLFAGKRFHLCAPPPIASEERIKSFPGAFKTRLPQGVTPARIRAKLYRLQSDIFRARCSELQMDCLLPPMSASDTDGFLKKECWSRDPTHGNVAYGRLVLQQIKDVTH
jgi:hypothetical protein